MKDKKSPECVSIECIYNDKLEKGLCIGVSKKTRSYDKDVIRMCWVGKKPAMNTTCDVKMQVQMTPKESVGVGVGLIRSSIIGEHLLNSTRVADNTATSPVAAVITPTDRKDNREVHENEKETN